MSFEIKPEKLLDVSEFDCVAYLKERMRKECKEELNKCWATVVESEMGMRFEFTPFEEALREARREGRVSPEETAKLNDKR